MDPEKIIGLNTEDFLDSLLKNAPFGIISIDDAGKISYYNLVARTLLPPETSNEIVKLLPKGRKSFDIGSISINKKYLSIKGVSVKGGFICILNDITRMKELELGTIQSIIAGQEKERRRIGREIHDGLGPLLSYAILEFDAFMDEFELIESDPTREKLTNIRKTLETISSDLRILSHHLIPRLLETFGLFSAFSNLITRINSSVKSDLEFYCNFNSEARFDPDLELNLYRCGQELLNNAVKHANASEILIQLIKHDTSLVLMVEDNGIGFEENEENPENFGIGLTNIETRVRTLNGVFIIESRKLKGTSASIEIPLLVGQHL